MAANVDPASVISNDPNAARELLPLIREALYANPPGGLNRDQIDKWIDVHVDEVVEMFIDQFRASRRETMRRYRDLIRSMLDTVAIMEKRHTDAPDYTPWVRRLAALSDDTINGWKDDVLMRSVIAADGIFRHVSAREAQFGRERVIKPEDVRESAKKAQAILDASRPKTDPALHWARQIGQRIDSFMGFVRTNTARSIEAARWIWTELRLSVAGWAHAYGNPSAHADVAKVASEDAIVSFLGAYGKGGKPRPEWLEMPPILRTPFPGNATDTADRLEWDIDVRRVTLEEYVSEESAINGGTDADAIARLTPLLNGRFQVVAGVNWQSSQIVSADVFERVDWNIALENVRALHGSLSSGVTVDEAGVEDDSNLSPLFRELRTMFGGVLTDMTSRVLLADGEQVLSTMRFSDRFIPLAYVEAFVNASFQYEGVSDAFFAFDQPMPDRFALLEDVIGNMASNAIEPTHGSINGRTVYAFADRVTPDHVLAAMDEAYKARRENADEDEDSSDREGAREKAVENAKKLARPIAFRRGGGTFVNVYVQFDHAENGRVWLIVPNEIMRARGEKWRKVRFGMGLTDAAALIVSLTNATTDGIAIRNPGARSLIEAGKEFPGSAPSIAKSRTGSPRSLKHTFTATDNKYGFRSSAWNPMPDSYVEVKARNKYGTVSQVKVTTFWWEEFITENMADMADSTVPHTITNPFFHKSASEEFEKYNRPGYSQYAQDEILADITEQIRTMFVSMCLAKRDEGWLDTIAKSYNARWRVHGSIGLVGEADELQRWGEPPRAKRLDPHQSSAVAWARQTHGGLVAFDVGVGKTLTALACVAEARQRGEVKLPVIVVPKPIIPQWQRVIAETLPDYRVIVIGLEQEALSIEKFANRRRFKSNNPDTDKPWTTAEILARYEARRMKPQQAPQRVEAWKRFAAGEYDLAIVTPVAFGAVSFDAEWLRNYVATTPALQRVIVANSRWTRKARAFTSTGRTMTDWRNHVFAEFFEKRTKTRTITDAKLSRSLRAEYPDGVTEEAAPFFTAHGITLDDDDYPINPDTRLPFTKDEANAWAKKQTPRDPVVWGVSRAEEGKTPLPIDMIVVDEAHQYKGLIMPERRGFANGGKVEFLHGSVRLSSRAWQLCFCAAATREFRGGSGGVLLLTATPAKATPLDLYNLLLLGAPDVLARFGVDDPEVFVNRFFGIEPDAVVDSQASLFYTNVATDVNNPLGEFTTLFNSIAVRRTADDVERLKGSLVASGSGVTSNGEANEKAFGVLTQSGLDFEALTAGLKHPRLRTLDAQGVVTSVHSIESAVGDALHVYPPFDGDRIDVPWEIRHNAKVPLAERPERVTVEMVEGSFQKEMYDAAQYALLSDAGGSIVPGLYLLALHPALPSFETRGRAIRSGTARLFDPQKESIWITEAERKAMLADLEADKNEDDEDEDEDEARKIELDESSEADDDENEKDVARYVLALESAFLPHEKIVAPATKEGVAKLGGSIDPSSIKFEAVCEKIIPTMIDTGDERHGSVNCGHLVFIEPVQANAYLFVLMRRRIAERRSAEIEKITREVHEQFPNSARELVNSEIQKRIDARLSRLDPDRVAVMNGPSTNSGDPNELQRLSDGFNGAHEELEDGTFRFTRRPMFDVLIANKVAYEGVDLQVRTCAVHHVDLPWTPADFIQRNGRSVRQGNANPVVAIYAYIVNHTLDLYRLRRVEGRRQWLEAMLSGSSETYRLGGQDDDTRIADALGALPKAFAESREANLRTLFAELRKNKKARIAEKTYGYLMDLIRTADELRAVQHDNLLIRGTPFGYLFGVQNPAAEITNANKKLYLAGLYGSLQALRAKNGEDAFPWVEMVVRAALNGDIVAVGVDKTAKNERTFSALYPGLAARDSDGKVREFVTFIERSHGKDPRYYFAQRGFGFRETWEVEKKTALRAGSASPIKTGEVDWNRANVRITRAAPPYAYPEEWAQTHQIDYLRSFLAQPDIFGSSGPSANVPFDVPLVTDKGTLLMSSNRAYLSWVCGASSQHPEIERIKEVANVRMRKEWDAYRERERKRAARLATMRDVANRKNAEEAKRFAEEQAEYEKAAKEFAGALAAFEAEQARYNATVASLESAIADAAVRKAAITAIPKPTLKAPTPPTLPKPAKVRTVKEPPPLAQPKEIVIPPEPARPSIIAPTADGFKTFIDAARRTPNLNDYNLLDCARDWFGRQLPFASMKGSLLEAERMAHVTAQTAHNALPFEQRVKVPNPPAWANRGIRAQKYGIDEAVMASIEAATNAPIEAFDEEEDAPIELDVIE